MKVKISAQAARGVCTQSFVMRARVIPLQYDSQGVEKHLTLKSLLKIY